MTPDEVRDLMERADAARKAARDLRGPLFSDDERRRMEDRVEREQAAYDRRRDAGARSGKASPEHS
jgi:hypothetical protein